MKRMGHNPHTTSSVLLKSLTLTVLAAVVQVLGATNEELFVFNRDFDLGSVFVTDAKVSRGSQGKLRVDTGHQHDWPGITLRAPQGHWNLSSFAEVVVTARNPGTNSINLFCRVDNSGADGTDHCVTGSVKIAGGSEERLRVSLKRENGDTLKGKLFGMRGYPVGQGGTGTVDPTRITQILVFFSKPSIGQSFEVEKIQAQGSYRPPTACVTDAVEFFPFIDSLGQYRHKVWPGKVKSAEELAERLKSERKELATQPGPSEWDKYGGWRQGPQLRATGFFRTEKQGGKWWLVDPEGHVFFSHGIDCVGARDATPIEERETWFESFPGHNPVFAEFFSQDHALKGHYAGRNPRSFSFGGANLCQKYGPNWATVYPEFIHQRLRSWGINTIANWSDATTALLRQTPYTDSVGSGATRMIQGSEGYWGKFPDVFDSSFAGSLRRDMESKKNRSVGDAWCIGYFSDNEMSWGDEFSLALAALKSPSDQACKQAFVADLKLKYRDILALNSAWGTTHQSWESLLECREAPDRVRATVDLAACYTKMAEQYFHTVREVIKGVAPNQLYLGCRFAWVNARAAAAAAKYCDVVSYNLYQRSVANFQFNGGADVPLLIGEFHFGALDRGMFHTGLVPVADQNARAQAYVDYVRGALSHPQFVGCHWFQYQDEPVIGRVYDEENYQIGFVDVADTPYRETIAASREVGYHLYTGVQIAK